MKRFDRYLKSLFAPPQGNKPTTHTRRPPEPIVINGSYGFTPINGQKLMDSWGEVTLLRGVN